MKARHGWTGCVLFYSAKHENRPVVYIGGGGGYTHGASESEILDYTKTNEWEKSECDMIHVSQFHWLSLNKHYHVPIFFPQ